VTYEIKGCWSSDVDDLEAWTPSRPEDVYYPLFLDIGPVGDKGADQFQIVVCTPQAIQSRPERRQAKLLVLSDYNWQKVRATLEKWVNECDGLDWDDALKRLRPKMHWEYEGMARREGE